MIKYNIIYIYSVVPLRSGVCNVYLLVYLQVYISRQLFLGSVGYGELLCATHSSGARLRAALINLDYYLDCQWIASHTLISLWFVSYSFSSGGAFDERGDEKCGPLAQCHAYHAVYRTFSSRRRQAMWEDVVFYAYIR